MYLRGAIGSKDGGNWMACWTSLCVKIWSFTPYLNGEKKKKKKRETVNIRDNDGPPIKENLTHSWKFLGDNRSDAIKIYFQLSVIKHTDNWFYNNRHYMFNPLTPKIWLLILPPCCYTFPCKLVMRIWCSIMTKIQVLPDKFEFLITNLLDSAQIL